MKHDAWRRHLAAYPFSTDIMPRYTDVDLWQHLNNVALLSLQIESVQRLLLDVLGDAAWRAGAATLGPELSATDFIAEAYYPKPLTAAARLTHVDACSVGIASALFQNGQCVGLHQSRLVCWAEGLPTPLPAELQAALQARLAGQAPLPPGAVAETAAPAITASAPAPAPAPVSAVAPANVVASTTSTAGDAQALGASGASAASGARAAPEHGLQALPYRPADFPAQFQLASRFGDHDAAGRASDQALGRMAEQGRVNLLTRLLGPERLVAPVGFMVAHVSLRWLQRGPAPQDWQVGSGVLRSSERAITIRAQLYEGEACRALCDSVMVAIDRDQRRSTRLPDDLRARVQALATG